MNEELKQDLEDSLKLLRTLAAEQKSTVNRISILFVFQTVVKLRRQLSVLTESDPQPK